MMLSESYKFGTTVVALKTRRVLAPEAQRRVDVRFRFTSFDNLEGELHHRYEDIHRFHLGQISLPRALPTIVSAVISHLHNVDDLRGFTVATLLSFFSPAVVGMGGSAVELLVHVGFLQEPDGSDEDVDLMLDFILQTRPAEEEMAEAVLEYYLDQIFMAHHGRSGGEPPSIQSVQRSPYGRGDGLEEECVICMEEFHALEEVSKMPCSHIYHSPCIICWLKRSNHCPICRYQMPYLCFLWKSN